jgi:hypothetical protein
MELTYTKPAWRQAATNRGLLRHYAEMVVVMLLGMAVLGFPLALAVDAISNGLADRDGVMLLNMGASMTIPMVLWMRLKHRHSWRATNEMALTMVVPTALAIAVNAAGSASLGAVMTVEHVLMFTAMFAVMVLRPEEYIH